MSIFFDRFFALCKEVGETPNSLAKKLGIPSGSITAWKKGTAPRTKTLEDIAVFFGTTVDYLLGRTDDPENREVKYYFYDDNMKADVSVDERGGFSLSFREPSSKYELIKLLSEIKNLLELKDFDKEHDISQEEMLELLQNAFLKMAEKQHNQVSTSVLASRKDAPPQASFDGRNIPAEPPLESTGDGE